MKQIVRVLLLPEDMELGNLVTYVMLTVRIEVFVIIQLVYANAFRASMV
jgi:hypothetical protein